jgi:hypothetical protein
MNINIGKKTREPRQQARWITQPKFPQTMGDALQQNRVHAGISGEHFKARTRRWIALKNAVNILAQQSE